MKTIGLLLLCSSLFAQSRTLSFSSPITQVEADNAGNVLVLLANRKMLLLDSLGNTTRETKIPKRHARVQPLPDLRVFTSNASSYSFLQPDWENTGVKKLDDFFAFEPQAIAAAEKPFIWVLDGGTHQLKKINTSTSEILVEKKWADEDAPSRLTVHHHFLFIQQGNTLWQLDAFGNVFKKWSIENSPLHFLQEEFYYQKNKELIFQNFISGESRVMPLPILARDFIQTASALLAVQEKQLVFFINKPHEHKAD